MSGQYTDLFRSVFSTPDKFQRKGTLGMMLHQKSLVQRKHWHLTILDIYISTYFLRNRQQKWDKSLNYSLNNQRAIFHCHSPQSDRDWGLNKKRWRCRENCQSVMSGSLKHKPLEYYIQGLRDVLSSWSLMGSTINNKVNRPNTTAATKEVIYLTKVGIQQHKWRWCLVIPFVPNSSVGKSHDPWAGSSASRSRPGKTADTQKRYRADWYSIQIKQLCD